MSYRPARLLLSIFSLCIIGFAQDTGTITGTVYDKQGAVVQGADVKISNTARGINRTTTSNQQGIYTVSGLPADNYDLTVTARGFKTYHVNGAALRVGQKIRLDASMDVGSAETVINVEGGTVAQVETQSSELAGTVTGKQITQLELNGRNFTQLTTLVPGVSNQTGQDEGTVGVYGNVQFSVNGGRTEYNNWEVDGGDNMDNGSNSTLNVYPSLESIAEFRVLTSNYGAQYGRNGSGTVEVETKSGTSKFHGNVYEFVRNDAFNARNYFQQTVPPYKKNDYGYTIGGPIFIPGHYNSTNKDKTFFFWSQEWRKDRVPGADFTTPVPSDAERRGNFSDLCPNPTTGSMSDCPSIPGSGGTLFPGNTVPIDPNGQAMLAQIPAPNTGAPGAAVFQASPVQPTNWREELFRVDQNIGSKMRATFRFIHDSWDTVTPSPLWSNGNSFPTIQTNFTGPGVGLVARLTATASPTLLNEFVFGYTADHITLQSVGAWQRPASMTMPGLFNNGFGGGRIAGFTFVGGIFDGLAQDVGFVPNGLYNSNPTYTFRDNVSKVIGKHNLQFGAYYVAAQKNELSFTPSSPGGSVNGFLTFDSTSPVSTGNPFADLLMGNIASFGQQNVQPKYYNRYKLFEPYFQDDWHVTGRLTLNLGLRLSMFGTYREKNKQAFNFDPNTYVPGATAVNPDDDTVSGNQFNGMVQCGVNHVPVGCMTGHLFNPAPRIGFAWDPTGKGKTAIRAGYGIFFEHTNGNEANTESLENSPPLVQVPVQFNVVGYNNIGTGTALPLTVTSIPNKAIWPYIQQWHLDIQQQLAKNTVAMISYVGSKGTHLTRQFNLNQLAPVPSNQNPYLPGEAIGGGTDPSTGDPLHDDCGTMTTPSGVAVTGQAAINLSVACGNSANPSRNFLGYADIVRLEDASSSSYNALQTSLRVQNLAGLQLSVAYTYSHSIDDASDRFDAGFVNSFDFRANRASSNFDQRHVLNISYVYDLPFFKTPGVMNKILGGWQFSGITTFQTGSPFNVLNTIFTDNAGVGNDIGSGSFPDRAGDPNASVPKLGLPSFGPLLFNPSAFFAPRGLTFGNTGRNFLRNPRRTNFDMGLAKHFPIRETMGFEFRAEAFNIFNHTQWGYLGGDAGSAAYNSSNSSFTNSAGCYAGANNSAGDTACLGQPFLRPATAHNPRILQLGLKFNF